MELTGIEIFRAGIWNDEEYTFADLDDMVVNFHLVGFNVPVKLGHADPVGAPAYGWVAKIRRVGDRLVADLRDLPVRIYVALKRRWFTGITAEIFWNLKRDGMNFRRALKSIALLGTEAGLEPLRDTYRGLTNFSADAIKVHTLKENSMSDDRLSETKGAGAEIDRKVRKLRAANPTLTYTQAYHAILQDPDNAELKIAYARGS